jgi:pullulanase/glycogen debranching enzyme
LNVRGAEMTQADWSDGNLRALGIWFGKRNDLAGHLLVLVNAAEGAQSFRLPASGDQPWIRQFDTAFETHAAASLTAQEYRLEASSIALLEC